MRLTPHLGWSLVVIAGSALLGCSNGGDSGGSADGAPEAPESCTAYASSFDGFHGWSTAPATTPADASDGLHGLGPLEVYWNQRPPHGATSFPVCTIIVKESQETDPSKRTVFAMVKNGDGFNGAGAVGWEWFSLLNNADGSVTILWRGLVAPAGQTYANQAIGDCNGCHKQVADNDYVWDSALQLANF
jgi:hypothetical protein